MILSRIGTKTAILGILTALAIGGSAPGNQVLAGTRIDEDKIYYGDARKYSRPAVVDAAKVYGKIPAHREIQSRKLNRNDPDYWPLMRKASHDFVKALRKVCQKKGFDLVGEARTIEGDEAPVPEITDLVIAALQEPATAEGKDAKDAKGAKDGEAAKPAPDR